MVPRETGNNAYAKFWRDKQRVLWYFCQWPFMHNYGFIVMEGSLRKEVVRKKVGYHS